MPLGQRLVRSLRSRWLVPVDLVLAAAALIANHFFQFFCRPVLWAWVLLVISITPVLFFNLFLPRLGRLMGVISFLFGIAACVCVYCILFLGGWNLWALPLSIGIPVALLAYVPHFLLIQIMGHLFTRSGGMQRTGFRIALGMAAAFALTMAIWFHANIAPIAAAIDRGPQEAAHIRPSYMTERMLGMHWKYHMSFCAYDGWRPPLHDPALVTAAWLNELAGQWGWYFESDPARADHWKDLHLLDARDRPVGFLRAMVLYQRLFPDRPLREPCSCAVEGRGDYEADPLFGDVGRAAP